MKQCKMRLNVEISQTGEKYRLISFKIDELLQFACNSACFDAVREACTTFCTHNAVKRAFKRRNISNGREMSLNFLQNRRIIAVCVHLGLFRRRKSRALRSARITHCKVRLNVEVSRTGEKYRLIPYKIDELLQFACIWAFSTTENACTTFCKHNTVKRAFKRRNISNGREISLNFLQNRRIIAICVYLALFRR